MNNYYLIVADIVTAAITFITFILCFINIYLFKHLEKHCKALSLYVISCFLFDFLNTLLIHFKYHNVGLLPLFNIMELFLLLYFLNPVKAYLNSYKIVILVGVLINIYEFVYYLFTNDYIINKGRVFNALFFLAVVFYTLSKDAKEVKNLWLLYMLIIYFSICFIQFVLLDFLVNIPDDSIFITWILYAIAGGILYVISTYYLWKNTKISNT